MDGRGGVGGRPATSPGRAAPPSSWRSPDSPTARRPSSPAPTTGRSQGAARAHRGRPQARSAPLRRGDLQPRARHRHGRGRPGRADRVAAERGLARCSGSAAPATRSARSPAGCCCPSTAPTSCTPRSPSSGCARGRSSRCDVPANPLDVLAQQVVAATAVDEWDVDALFDAGAAGGAVLLPAAQRLRRDARPAERPLPERRVRRAAAADRVGPGHRHADRPAGCPAARGDQRRHDPRPRAVRGLPRRREGLAGSASSTRRWSTSRGSATSSPSVRRAGGSRTSPTTGCWSPPRRASPAGCRSGRATSSAGPPSSARPSARSPASSASSSGRRGRAAAARPGSTSGRRRTSSPS